MEGSNGAIVQHQIKPFRLMKGSELPTAALQKELRLKWRPIMKMMEEAPGVDGTTPSNPRLVTDEFVRSTYEKATEHLKKRVSYLWNNGKNPDNNEISTWSKKIGRGETEKHGNDQDKKELPEKTIRNQPHKRKRKISNTVKHTKILRAAQSASSSRPAAPRNRSSDGPRRRGGGVPRRSGSGSEPAGNDFLNSFPMEEEEETRLLNSQLSRNAELAARAELDAEVAENSAENGRVAAGDGDGNALYVRRT